MIFVIEIYHLFGLESDNIVNYDFVRETTPKQYLSFSKYDDNRVSGFPSGNGSYPSSTIFFCCQNLFVLARGTGVNFTNEV